MCVRVYDSLPVGMILENQGEVWCDDARAPPCPPASLSPAPSAIDRTGTELRRDSLAEAGRWGVGGREGSARARAVWLGAAGGSVGALP